ncbi:MAG: hypothetical protein ACOYM8_11090 [Caulobacterales bacterium]
MSAPLIPPPPRRGDHDIAPGHTRYRVILCEWLSHEIWIDAATEADAEDAAVEIWADEGADAFSWKDSGVDGAMVVDSIAREEVQP